MSDQTANKPTTSATAQGRRDEKQRKAFQAKVWMTLSFLLTACILVWAFSLPFRKNGTFAKKDRQVDRGTPRSVIESQSSDQDYLETAIAMDQEFMRKRAEKAQQEAAAIAKLPGKQEVKIHWQKHVESVKKQIAELGDPPEGSPEWDDIQELKGSLQDGPL